MLTKGVSDFLLEKQAELSCSQKYLAEKTGLSPSVINELIKEHKPQPELNTLIKIADAFNVKIDAVLGNQAKGGTKINNLPVEKATLNLRKYISSQINNKQNPSKQLAAKIGLGKQAISDFISTPPKKKTLGTHIIAKLANHWDVSIDEMIGRAVPAKDKAAEVEANLEKATKSPEPSKQAKSTSPIVEKILKQKQEIQSPSRKSHAERILEERSKSKDQKRER